MKGMFEVHEGGAWSLQNMSRYGKKNVKKAMAHVF
jgi:hypothetical protein